MRKPLKPRDVRVGMNAVTGQLETTILDRVQLAVERVHQVIDGRALAMTNDEYARFADRLAELVAGMKRSDR